MTTFNIEMLPANEGDALWITYAKDGEPNRHVLIDCGRTTAYRTAIDRFENNPDLNLELFVLTHVDADHIAGGVRLLQDGRFGPNRVKDVWYNGWPQIDGFETGVDIMGAQQGEYFGAVLIDRDYSWNRTIEGDVVVVKADEPLPTVDIDGDLRLTLLSPTPGRLARMRERWIRDLGAQDDHRRIPEGDWERALEVLEGDRANLPDVLSHDARPWPPDIQSLATSDFESDKSEPNGSSIAFLAEVGDKAVLFAGDAHSPVLEANIRRLLADRGEQVLRLDAYKMSHHGSAANNSLELGSLIECPLYLVSTNGSGHHHPDHEAIARMIWAQDSPVTFAFNYRSDHNRDWEEQAVQQQNGYKTVYAENDKGLIVPL
jgi:hypothetical protein